MLKRRLTELMRQTEAEAKARFEIIQDPGATLLMGAESCTSLNCSTFSCTSLDPCGVYSCATYSIQ